MILKKLSLRIAIFTILASVTYSQNYNWIIPNKTYLKLFVNEDAVYRITRTEFTQAGINTNNIDPRTVKVYYKGQEIPIYFEGEQDGTFDANDFIDFYGERNHGGITNTYLASFGPTTLHYTTDEYYNSYSDTNVYWVGWDGTNGLRFNISTYFVQNEYSQNFSFEKLHFEKDSLYSPGETVNPNADFRYFNNEKISGEGWYWRNLTSQHGYSVSSAFTIPLLFSLPQLCTFRIFAYPNSKDTVFNEHRLVLRINSTIIATISKNDYERFDTTVTFSSSLLTSSTNNVSVTYSPIIGNPNITPSLYFDLIELTYPKIFKFQNGSCKITLSGSDSSSTLFKITGFSAANPVSIYDKKNNIKITNISSNFDTLFFTGKKNGEFEVVNQNITKRPFRIEPRQVPNLVSSTNGADYLVIYNRLFESHAEQLRSHRQSRDNFRSVKASVDDIIDIFNYGLTDPVAIRRFVKHVYDNWQAPKVRFVCLFGRGSLDPKNNRIQQSFYKNLIPVYGYPLTDGYFVNFNLNGFTYDKQVSVGRIPAYTQLEAQDIVNKIINYDNEPLDNWIKAFLMITGGPNRNEQLQFQAQSNLLINSYINPPPISGDAHKIYRNDSAGGITFNYADSIKREINRGGLIINFIGHAASQDWELGLEDPLTLSNGNRLPLVLSMTCFTGRNSEPNFRGFGEKFIYAQNRGAVGFLGSTGWSFASAGNDLNKYIFQGFAQDTLRRIGELVKYASNRLAPDSANFQVRNMINCYDLLGDPASKLILPSTPEFVIGQTDYRISNPYPITGEQVNLTIYPKNLGTFAKDCLIRFEILKNGGPYRHKDTLIANFAYSDTASYIFSIDTIGNYSLKVTLDYDDRYPQEIPTNNILILPLPLRNISYTPLKPIRNSVIRNDTVEFVGLNPQIDPTRNSIKIILQVDTSRTFPNPLLTYTNTSVSGVATKVKYRIPVPDSNIVYFWRTNSIINNDSTGWSETMRFVYNPLVSSEFSRSFFNDSVVTIYTKLRNQYDNMDISNLVYSGTGFELTNYSGQLQVKSFGSNGSEASYFIINNFTLYADGGQNTGLNIVKVRRLTGNVLEFKNFRMSTPTSSDSVLNFLNTFDTTHFVMIGIATHVSPSDSLRQTAKNKIKQFGSVYADSIKRFDSFDSWAFIGYLGALSQNAPEQFHRYSSNNTWTPSFASLNPTFISTFGTINFSIGPAHRWKYFSWDRLLNPNSYVNYDVIGINTTDDSTIFYSNLTFNTFVNLDTLNSFQYPNLRLIAKLTIDTLGGLLSPLFKSMFLKYTPPAEIIPDNYSIVKSDSIVQEGAQVTFSVKTYNVGYVPAGTVIYKWTANAPSGLVVLKSDTVYSPLDIDSVRVSTVTFSTQGLRNQNLTVDTVEINFEVSMLGNQNDYYPFNNFAFSNIIVTGDSTGPSIEVTYDGEKILNGDLIPSKPEIVFKFFDDGKLDYTIDDTSSIFIKLDGRRLYYNSGGQPNPELNFDAVNSGNLKTIVTYKPILSEGSHQLQYIGGDKDGNRDTVINDVYVSYAFTVKNLFNYPNPMRSDTYFTFNLFSSKAPQSCKIKIFTVAGRLIKDISAPAKVGFNHIYWDGKDNDGENMANGIYLYKLILEDEGKIETSIQKLAILR
ncbi:MAG: C25 family cysteine peptidase [Chlorobi bacterium]|nr:C25 family cysteine peptidase [Chlorobiota bacterium]MCI0716897.1 C25 family cysteine peptidase [Chlorobiota bacterium]